MSVLSLFLWRLFSRLLGPSRQGRAVAQLVPVRKLRTSPLGAMRGEFEMVQGWERALTDEEAEAFWGGR